MASAWGPHLQQVVGVPVSLSCGSAGGQEGRAVGGGSIHKFYSCSARPQCRFEPVGR